MGLLGLGSKPGTIYKTDAGNVVYGVMAQFSDPAQLYHAAEKVRDAGYRRWDVYAPFPVHGMEEAMGLRDSKIGLVCGVVGLTGAGLGFLLQYGVSNWLYETVVQGKANNVWEAYVPITFELGILSTAFAALLGMMALNGLPRWHHPLLAKERFLRVSDDRFMICVEAKDPKFDPEATRALLHEAGATDIEVVEE